MREELLGLHPVPGYVDIVDGVDTGKQVHGRKGGDGKIADDKLSPKKLNAGKFLLGIPALLLPAAGATAHATLPPRAVVCGYWSPPATSSSSLGSDVQSFFSECEMKIEQGVLKGPAFYIGFGSIGAEGLVPDAGRVAKLLLDTARWMGRPVVLMSHMVCPGLCAQLKNENTLLVTEDRLL